VSANHPDQLQRDLDELQASRARVVAAANADRRRIERALHDGVQQQLVALVVNLQLARQLTVTDPAAVNELLEEIGRDAREALDDVRALAQGIYPALLLDRGLAEALSAAASGVGIPTRVDAAALDRYPPDVEATLYFCCLEALESAAARAVPGTSATLEAWQADGELAFDVTDDGVGSEPAEPPPAAIGDRIGALGGRVTISCEPEGGTRVSGRIPLAP
jgi:signal transduction histidine kinase